MEETVPFDRDQFPLVVQRVQSFLAELSYIDKALEYIRLNDDRHGFHGDRKLDELHIELGTLHPFHRTLKLPEDWRNDATVRDDLAAFAEEADSWAMSNMEALTYHADWITRPDVRLYNHIITNLNEVRLTLAENINPNLGDLGNNLGDWKGEAAENFADHFHSPMGLVIGNQAALAEEIVDAFLTSQRIARLAQHSIMNAVTYTEQSLREQLLKRKEDNQGLSTKQFFILAARAVALMSNVGGVAGSSLEALATALDFAEFHIPERVAETYTIEGATADELCTTLFDTVHRISRNARDSYGGMEADLQALNARMDEHRRAGRLTAARPALVDGITDGEEFHHAHSG